MGEPAVGRVRRVVGRWDPLPRGGLRRLASASASVLSRVGWRLLGLPGGCPLVSGRLGAAGVAGLLRVGCSVIPAGLARVPGRRPSGLPVPCEASPAGGAAAARPAVDGPRSVGSLPLPARRRSFLSRSSSGRPAAVLPGPSSRGGSRARTGPGAVAGCLGGKGRPAGGRKLRFEGRPGRRGRGGASRLVSWRRVRGERRPARRRGERGFSGCRPRRSVGPVG